jgi:hypothetical protein
LISEVVGDTKEPYQFRPVARNLARCWGKVVRVQISEHDSLGTIFYRIGRHWLWHWKAAVEARSDLGRLHNQIELLPLDRNNTRFVYANETVSEHE